MASQNIVFPEELQRLEASPSEVSCLFPKLDCANQSRIGANLDVEEFDLAEFYLAEAQHLAHIGSWAWQVAGGHALHLSEEWYRIFGFDPRKGMPGWEERLQRVYPADRGKWQGTIERAIRERLDYDLKYRILLPDGRTRWIHALGHPVLGAARELVQFRGISMDVTERETREEKIREQDAELRQILDLTPQLIAVYGPNRERLYINRIALDYLGLSLEEWRQTREWSAFVHPDDRARERDYFASALATGSAYELELRLRKADGSYRWFLARSNPFRDDQGQIRRWYLACTDIEDRKRAEDKTREREAELRQILDLSPQLIAVFGPRFERLFTNRIGLDYFGLTLDEWRDTAPGALGHPDDVKRFHFQWERAVSGGFALEIELRLRKSDGSYHWFLARYNPVRDEQGQITRWYAAATDIENRKQAEERLQRENVALREEIDETSMFEEIVGTSPALQAVLSSISKVAPTDSTVLVTGETGTGKELVARAIHRRSDRSSRALVSVNCAAIPRDLIASELFGHEKGAFTGATQRRLGRFELAEGGTIFLDEVGELLPDIQVALLRVLQEREFEPIGGVQPIQVDVRVVAATNRDLKAAVTNGIFRQDLFYRLNVFPVEVPPLRDRRDDLLMLVEYFVQRYAKRAGKHIRSIDKQALRLLQSYDWPGNVRELQNIIERAVILSSGGELSVDESWLSTEMFPQACGIEASAQAKSAVGPRNEREIIEAVLVESRGQIRGLSGAAAKLGIPPSTLDHRIKALGIDKRHFKYQLKADQNHQNH